VIERLNGNVDTLLASLGAGKAAGRTFSAEVSSPGASGDASPFLKALFPEVKIAAMVERSLNTALGRGLDHLVADIAQAAHGNGRANHFVNGSIPAATAAQINAIVEHYTSGSGHTMPNTTSELSAILPGVGSPGARETVREKDDVYFVGNDGIENHIEIKTPKPNYDQGRRSKRRILRIHAVCAPTNVRAFVGMPYNPNGRHGTYEWPTTKYFLDPMRDLKVGIEFWNYVGDSSDTYDLLLDCFLEVSRARRAELLALIEEV
jgi:hypothetical protein